MSRARPRRTRPSRARLDALLVAALVFASPVLGSSTAAATAPERTETAIVSSSPQTDVAESLVRLYAPLPATAAPHPDACDWLQYLRFRSADGPARSTDADAVTVLMPGLLEGATAFDPVARNTVREARRRGRSVEVWAIDRRANCLEDLTGLQYLERTGDKDRALDYYYDGAELDGRTFAGFHTNDRALADIGMAQTVQDYHAVLTRELPSQPWRERHVICGGHSLGAPLIEVFAGWDFDGDDATTDDAGYRQCAGFVAFDSVLDLGLTTPKPPTNSPVLNLLTAGTLSSLRQTSVRALRSGTLLRHIEVLGIAPESMSLVEALGYVGATEPTVDAAPMIARIPRSKELETYYHLAGSADLLRWANSRDSLRDLHYTYAGMLGQLLDDNGSPAGITRASFGYFDGAPLQRNRLPEQVSLIPGLNLLLQKGAVMLPRRITPQPIVGWRNYDDLGSGASQLGRGVTTPDSEVTDAATLARILYEGPTNFTEAWFPTRIVTDLILIASGSRAGDLAAIRYPNPTRLKPRIGVMAGDGFFRRGGINSTDPHVTLPGYEHLDVITAAERQNNGRPEQSSQSLANLIDIAVPR